MATHAEHKMHAPYRGLAIEMAVDFVVMYLVMYTMIAALDYLYFLLAPMTIKAFPHPVGLQTIVICGCPCCEPAYGNVLLTTSERRGPSRRYQLLSLKFIRAILSFIKLVCGWMLALGRVAHQ
jgi:hypothetical protein